MADTELRGVEISPVSPADVEELSLNMRGPDRAELAAMGISDAHEALWASISISLWSRAAHVDGELACIFGVATTNLLRSEGAPWMLGTRIADEHPVAFMRLAPLFVQEMLATFDRLQNVVDVRNVRAVRWLRHAGFTIREPIPLPPEGFLFHPFDMSATV